MAFIMGMIFFLSHQPPDFARLPQVADIDKLAHALAYGMLAISFLFGLHPFASPYNRLLLAISAVLFCTFYGLIDEFHQSFIPGRLPSFWDVAADGFGALAAAGAWYMKRHDSRAENSG
jgi:VanZ family protein